MTTPQGTPDGGSVRIRSANAPAARPPATAGQPRHAGSIAREGLSANQRTPTRNPLRPLELTPPPAAPDRTGWRPDGGAWIAGMAGA